MRVASLAYTMTEDDEDMNFSDSSAAVYRKMTRDELLAEVKEA